jgi:hypothetical protein
MEKSTNVKRFLNLPGSTPTQNTYSLLLKEHIKLIQQCKQTINEYNNEIFMLEQNGGRDIELEWLKNVRQDLIKQTDENNNITFIISKLNKLEREL